MRLPHWTLRPLLALHAWGMRRPYYDIHSAGEGLYMARGWVLGYHSRDRNEVRSPDAPAWHGRTLGRLHAWLTRRVAIRAHVTHRSDHDRALHDHPVSAISVVLENGYWEVTEPTDHAKRWPVVYARWMEFLPFSEPDRDDDLLRPFGIHWRGPGAVVYRPAEMPHRLVLPVGRGPAKSLWIMGRKRRSWGFHAPRGWVGWREYLGIGGGA